MTRLNEEQLISLFHEPRTVSSFTENPSPTSSCAASRN